MKLKSTANYIQKTISRLEWQPSYTLRLLYIIPQDSREIGVPLLWFPGLRKAAMKQMNDWRLNGNGIGIHGESIDEDITVSAFL